MMDGKGNDKKGLLGRKCTTEPHRGIYRHTAKHDIGTNKMDGRKKNSLEILDEVIKGNECAHPRFHLVRL